MFQHVNLVVLTMGTYGEVIKHVQEHKFYATHFHTNSTSSSISALF